MLESQLTTLGLLFVFAIIGGLIATKVKQPIVLGLLLVGAIIGPHALGIIADGNLIDALIEFGTILLLFVIGLEFSVSKLSKLGLKASLVALFKVSITFFIGYLTGILLNLGVTTALFIGVVLSFTSTIVLVKVLQQQNMFERKEVPLLMGVLILEDILAVVFLTFLTGMSSGDTGGIWTSLEHIYLALTALIIIYLVLQSFSDKIVNWVLLNYEGEEALVFVSFGICAGYSYLAYALGISASIGAFLAGSIVSSFRDSKNFERAVRPYTLIFSSLFFIAIGTLIDFTTVGNYIGLILLFLCVLIFSRIISMALTTTVFASYKDEQMLFSTLSMFSVGEFSLLIAKEAPKFGVTIDLVTISAIVIFITAIFMSIALQMRDKIYSSFITGNIRNITHRVGGLSGFISAFFTELENDNSTITTLNKCFLYVIGSITGIVAAVVGTRKSIEILYPIFIWSPWFIIPVCTLVVSYLVAKIYRNSKMIRKLMIDIMVHFDSQKSRHKTQYILRNLTIGTMLILFGLLSPILFMIFDMNSYYTITSGVLILAGIFYLRRANRIMQSYSQSHKYFVPSYKKLKIRQ